MLSHNSLLCESMANTPEHNMNFHVKPSKHDLLFNFAPCCFVTLWLLQGLRQAHFLRQLMLWQELAA